MVDVTEGSFRANMLVQGRKINYNYKIYKLHINISVTILFLHSPSLMEGKKVGGYYFSCQYLRPYTKKT